MKGRNVKMGLALGIFSILAISAIKPLIFFIVRIWETRRIWKKVWVMFFLYIAGALLLTAFMAFNIIAALAVLNYGK